MKSLQGVKNRNKVFKTSQILTLEKTTCLISNKKIHSVSKFELSLLYKMSDTEFRKN